MPDPHFLVVRADWLHGYTEAEQARCADILENDVVDHWATLLSFPGTVIAWLKDGATDRDAEVIAQRLGEIPHLSRISVRREQRESPRGPRRAVVHKSDSARGSPASTE